MDSVDGGVRTIKCRHLANVIIIIIIIIIKQENDYSGVRQLIAVARALYKIKDTHVDSAVRQSGKAGIE